MRPVDALDDFIEALLSGADIDDLARGAPPELSTLAHAASTLVKGREVHSDGPRPAFVLELEQQMRTDLRMESARWSRLPCQSRVGGRLLLSVLVAMVIAIGALVMSQSAYPGQTLYPMKRGIERLELMVARTMTQQIDVHSRLLWRRLAELQVLAGYPDRDDGTLQVLLDDLLAGHSAAFELAMAITEDPRVLRYVVEDADLAADALTHLSTDRRLSPEERELTDVARRTLRVRLLDARIAMPDPRSPNEPVPTTAPIAGRAALATAIPARRDGPLLRAPGGESSPTPVVPARDAAMPTAVQSIPGAPPMETPTIAPTAPPVDDPPTTMPPTAVAAPTEAPRGGPPARLATPTATPLVPQTPVNVPRDTPSPVQPSPTPTADRWPTATTPPIRPAPTEGPPAEPSERPPVPTSEPPPTAVPTNPSEPPRFGGAARTVPRSPRGS